MDANGLRLWSFSRQGDWRLPNAAGLQWSTSLGTLRLSSRQSAPMVAENEARARVLAASPSIAVDAAGTWAFWDPATASLRVAGAGRASAPLTPPPDTPPGVAIPADLALGADDVLYVARNGAVVLVDRRDRWPSSRAALAGFNADRLAPAEGGGVWVLDRTAGRLARLSGLPLRDGPYYAKNDDVFTPVQDNPDPPTLRLRQGTLPADCQAIDIACSPGGQVMLLAWRAAADAVLLRWRDGVFVRQCTCAGLRFPFGMAWLDETRLALLATNGAGLARQAFVYELDVSTGPAALPSGAIYPLIAPWAGGLAKAPGIPPRYAVTSLNSSEPASPPAEPLGLRPLLALSRASYARAGGVLLGPLDAQASGSVWHRIYLEAAIPPRCGVRVWAWAAGNGAVPPAPGEAGAPAWHPHVFGASAALDDVPDAAAGAWLPVTSEVPFDPGLLCCPPRQDRSGLFTALLQRPGKRVRAVAGHYLWLYVELLGDSLATPEIAALRINGPRFSYRDRYLPPLYRESTFPPDADAAGPATPPDFLDRFLGLFEGVMTGIEDRVGESWRLTDPAVTPDAALPWLASWTAVDLDEHADPARQRAVLSAAPYAAALHGTLGGLHTALELATGGVLIRGGQIDMTADIPQPGQLALAQIGDATFRVLVLAVARPGSGGETVVLVGGDITSGALVVVEGFRLRRTFATILGADLGDETDTLTLGGAASGNSFVGDTLFLGDVASREFLALFDAASLTAAEQGAVDRFFDSLASRVMVLVRDGVPDAAWRRLARIAEAASPAHIATTVQSASPRLMVGVASLIGIDTFLEPKPAPGTMTIDASRIGKRDLLGGGGRLDARGGAAASAMPIAVADGPETAIAGQPFLLSAIRSAAAPGRRIDRYIWTWTGEGAGP